MNLTDYIPSFGTKETPEECMKKCQPTPLQTGGSRRRRSRCTKKHRHSSACKRKSKGRKSYRKRR